MSILDLIKPAPPAEEIQDQELIKKQYRYWRVRIFYAMYIGYAFFYFTRKSFTFAMPAMISELGMTKTELGILGGILYVTYGLSKFLSGILSDKSNPRYFMAIGLILTGFFNICFGFSSSLFMFAIFWGLNGWFQGWGWPPCARLLTHWYSQKERGTWWGIWNTCHNVGGALIAMFVATCINHFGGWQYGMWGPGALCIIAGFFLINRLRDTPQSLGLPPIEKHRNDYPSERKEDFVEQELTAKEILLKYVLKNKFIWVLAISYFFVYIIRTAVNDWGIMFLTECKHFTLLEAGSCVVWFEVGGFMGNLCAGWLSDRVCGGKRGPINVLFSLGAIGALAGLWFGAAGYLFFYSVFMFLIGFFIFGPQMLIGIAAVELSHKKAAGTANGFASCFAYFGAALTGYLGKITDDYGWYAFFLTLGICGVISVLLLIPLWSTKNLPDRELESAAS